MASNGNTSTLGERIQEARREAGYRNVETVAVELGVSFRTFQRWEQGASEPSIAQVRQIAALTKKPLAFFIVEAAA